MGILRHNRLASNGVRGNLRFGILIRQYCLWNVYFSCSKFIFGDSGYINRDF